MSTRTRVVIFAIITVVFLSWFFITGKVSENCNWTILVKVNILTLQIYFTEFHNTIFSVWYSCIKSSITTSFLHWNKPLSSADFLWLFLVDRAIALSTCGKIAGEERKEPLPNNVCESAFQCTNHSILSSANFCTIY